MRRILLGAVVAIAAGGVAHGEEPKAKPGAAAAPAPAPAEHGRWELGGFFGVRSFSSDSALGRSGQPVPGSESKNAVPFGARLGYRLNHAFSLEGELALMPTETVRSSANLFIVGYRVQGVYWILDPKERLQPLVALGVGGEAQLSDNDKVIEDGTIFLVHAGVGARYWLADSYGARLDAHFLLGPAYDGSFAAGHGEVLFSIYVDLGGKSAPRPLREDEKPPPLLDDGDGDGIPDDKDECPGRAEDLDGQDDADGCPEADEDVDSDHDGVLGSLDKCPKEKESVNGYQDDDGCPDQPPAAVAEFTGTIEGISFPSAGTKVSKKSFAVLDRVVKLLEDNPGLHVIIVGHTDDRGGRERNVALSHARAEAVKAYLVAHGIAEDRLDAEGRGPDQPLEDNGTASGRAANRRIEFQIVGKAGAATGAGEKK